MNIPSTLFMVWTDFGPAIGQGVEADPAPMFDDAVDQYAEARRDDRAAIIWRIDTPHNGQAGMATDVTADAEDCIRRRCAASCTDLPDWLFDRHQIAAE
ncbi:hypothetical protein [Oceaniglobus ichthyenteri]|uniref:hypothetical protein n=1 Tax=Oceaniglobus ichthyenteri TaxID=2136177 RepID=UPI000F820BA9|nr:hypothetical protein [Oceaniglobus ichthyenteri]